MILRNFYVTEQQAIVLGERADSLGMAVGDLVREYVDAYLADPKIYTFQSESRTVLRSYHLTIQQDTGLQTVSDRHGLPKGMIFRLAINEGLGINR